MKNLNKSVEKKKEAGLTSASKTVQFKKDKTPLSQKKKKFAKTPHSSKTPGSLNKGEISKSPFRNKRKLSFSSADEALSPPTKSPKTPITNTKFKGASPLNQSAQRKSQSKADLDSEEDEQQSDYSGSDDSAVKTVGALKKKKAGTLSSEKRFSNTKLTEEEKAIGNQENTIFVGNLPIDMTKLDVEKEFKKFGLILNARLRCIPLPKLVTNRKLAAIRRQGEGSSVSAFVKFSTLASAKKALSSNGKLLKGHHIRVDMADPAERPAIDRNKAVFLRHLHKQLTEDELWTLFEGCGKINSVRIIKDKRDYTARGLGYVNFNSTSAVELALKLNGTELKGKPIIVQRCEAVASKPKKLPAKKQKKKGGNKNIKKIKNAENVVEKKKISESDFSGNKAKIVKKKKEKKLGASGMKKKKISEILTKK